MPKPTTTTEGRDYGKRLYVSRQAYQKQMRRLTDAHRDRGASVPHSESKKPYLPDQKYQEMEYFDYPWDGPNFPGYPGFPDDPGINDDPEVDGFHSGPNNPPKGGGEFLGCEFIGPFVPTTLSSGDTATAKLARRDDPIVGFTVQGPAVLLTGSEAVNCTSKYQRTRAVKGDPPQPSSPECTVIIKVDDPINFDKWGTSGGAGEIVVVAYTQSGGSCSTSAFFLACDNVEPMTWDSGTSISTIVRNNNGIIAVEGGQGPFYWSVSGTGFSLASGKTTGEVRSNILYANGSACGMALITVVDSCGNEATGEVRCTSGAWIALTPNVCVAGGAQTSFTCPDVWGTHVREELRYQCVSSYDLSINPSPGQSCSGTCQSLCAEGDCVSCEPCVIGTCGDCSAFYAGSVPCCEYVPTGALRCTCESVRQCYEWGCE